jgi:trehalose 6-phosphate phosphatase
MVRIPGQLDQRLAKASKLWLFLDYDGTLAEFAATPEHVDPDPDLIELLTRLAGQARLRIAVISGRRLGHVRSLVPVPGVLLAGTYGVELQLPGGEQVERVAYTTVRPVLDSLKPVWEQLLSGGEGFFLEDKGWALALHARFADEDEAERVLGAARRMATQAASSGPFRVLGGHRFLEIGPKLAHKGLTVAYLVENYPWPGALPVYVGDDDKDEEAFGVIQAYAGIAILVARASQNTGADFHLGSPQVVRHWLEALSGEWGE